MFLIHLFYAVGILSFFLIIWWVLSDVLLSGPLASIGKPYKWLSKKCEKKKKTFDNFKVLASDELVINRISEFKLFAPIRDNTFWRHFFFDFNSCVCTGCKTKFLNI